MNRATLYLIPTPLNDASVGDIPPRTLDVLRRLDTFVVENPKTARAVLKRCLHPRPLNELTLLTLDEHSTVDELDAAFQPLLEGRDVGLMSEAGCPAVADPGTELVRLAHGHAISVVPLAGPSALLLALMASGFGGQRFAFHGYLPVERAARTAALRALEQRSRREAETQLFIETPYRNDALLTAVLETCQPKTWLSIASDLTAASETIISRTVLDWRRAPIAIGKVPAVFSLSAVAAARKT